MVFWFTSFQCCLACVLEVSFTWVINTPFLRLFRQWCKTCVWLIFGFIEIFSSAPQRPSPRHRLFSNSWVFSKSAYLIFVIFACGTPPHYIGLWKKRDKNCFATNQRPCTWTKSWCFGWFTWSISWLVGALDVFGIGMLVLLNFVFATYVFGIFTK